MNANDLLEIHGNIRKSNREFTDAKPVGNPSLSLATEVIKRHPEGFIGSIVYGPRRLGKSIYALKNMMQIFQAYGCGEDEAWDLSLLSLYFDPRKLLEDINWLAETMRVWPVLCLDDAGCGVSGSIWFTDRGLYQGLGSVLDTIGTTTTGFLLTTPTFKKIVCMVRDATDFYRIEVKPSDRTKPRERIASAYGINVLPSGDIRIKSKSWAESGFSDVFSVLISNERYYIYKRIRALYTVQTTKFALDMIKKRRKPLPTREELQEIKQGFSEAERIISGKK